MCGLIHHLQWYNLMGFSRGPKIVTDGLVLALDAGSKKSYPGSGTTWKDLSGNGYNATLTNSPGYNSGSGGGINFDGVDDYGNLGDVLDDVFAGTNPKYSVSFWVKFDTLVDNVNYALLSKSPVVNASRRQFLFLVRNLTAYSFGGFQVDVVNYNNPNLSIYRLVRTTGSGLTTGTIYNITITFDGSIDTNNGEDRVNIYVNGVAQSKTLWLSLGTLSDVFQSSTARIGIGAIIDESGNNPSSELDGTIYNTMVYNRTLSANEVSQNYNATKKRFGL